MREKLKITQDYLSGYEEGRKLNYFIEKRKDEKEKRIDEVATVFPNKAEIGMKAVSMGLGQWNIYDKNLKVSDRLPSLVFRIEFNPQQGFYLQEEPFIYVSEKIYGKHKNTVKLMIEGFEQSDRNIGIIFSGEKGLGKSLTAKYLCQEMLERDYPVIIVTHYIEGLNNFLRTIQQEVVVYLDEFDKIFKNINSSSTIYKDVDEISSYRNNFYEQPIQDRLLSLFDGTSIGKKMFLLTCNNVFNLSNYLLNRTGRCHYHIRFDYPDSSEIEEYLKDNLKSVNKEKINQVIEFANKVKLNYDALRSICFELNLGREFNDIIGILNILNIEAKLIEVKLQLSDNKTYKTIESFVLDKDNSVTIDFRKERFYVDISLRGLVFKNNYFFIENPERNVKINLYNGESRDKDSNELFCTSCILTYKQFGNFNYSI